MAVSKILREQVRNKYNGLCAYSGKTLDDKWQVDHVLPKSKNNWILSGYNPSGSVAFENVDCIENLLPAIRIVNHYKGGLDLKGFRTYMLDFHLRLKKLPKKTSIDRILKRIEYMNSIANIFEITIEKPFSGIFFFERIIDLTKSKHFDKNKLLAETWLLKQEGMTVENLDFNLKIGDRIYFNNTDDENIIFTSIIFSFDKETGNAYVYWSSYWFQIQLKERLLKI